MNMPKLEPRGGAGEAAEDAHVGPILWRWRPGVEEGGRGGAARRTVTGVRPYSFFIAVMHRAIAVEQRPRGSACHPCLGGGRRAGVGGARAGLPATPSQCG